MSDFTLFAGIDGVAPLVHGTRRDQHARSNHKLYWRDDFKHVLDLGMDTLRWGSNWYEINYAPHRFDWSQMDDRIEYAHSIGLNLWLVLQHKQVPDWIDIDDPEFPDALCEYGVAVANRYPHINTYFVTVEPDFYARMGCLEGKWSPHRTDAYRTAYHNFARAIRITAESIRRVRAARIIHCDYAPGLALARDVAPHVDALALDYYRVHGRSLIDYLREWASLSTPLYIGETGLAGGEPGVHHDAQIQAYYIHDVFETCRNARREGIDLRGVCIYPTVVDNFYWGSDQCFEYACLYPPGAHTYEGDNAGGFYRCLAGSLARVPEPVMVQALFEEVARGID